MKAQILLFRAKRIDSDEYVIGWVLQDCFGLYIIPKNNALRCENLNWESVEIDPSTLEVSFDGDNSWYSDFESIADICREYLPKIEQKA